MMGEVNGYPIRAAMQAPATAGTRPGRIILVQRNCQHDPWVTAWQGGTEAEGFDRSWCWGHYFENRDDALVDFAARVRRGY